MEIYLTVIIFLLLAGVAELGYIAVCFRSICRPEEKSEVKRQRCETGQISEAERREKEFFESVLTYNGEPKQY